MTELVALDDTALDGVVGGEAAGPNVTTSSSGNRSVSTSRTDYAHCVDTVRTACERANPGFLGFGTNTQAAGQCTLQNLPNCPTPQAGGQQ